MSDKQQPYQRMKASMNASLMSNLAGAVLVYWGIAFKALVLAVT